MGIERLEEFLIEQHARVAWEHVEGNGSQRILNTMYLVNGRTLFVQRFANGGWEAYLPAIDDPSIEATMLVLQCRLVPDDAAHDAAIEAKKI